MLKERGIMTTHPVPAPPAVGLQIEEYVRKPFVVQVVRVTERNMPQVARWCGGEVKALGEHDGRTGPYIQVNVNRPLFPRQTQAFVGDWVLYTPSGGFKVYTDKAFNASFERPSLIHGDNADFTPEDLALRLTYGDNACN
jgi:hypothetical protein